MTKLYLDFETQSAVDLKAVGQDNYFRSPSTRALMLAWAIDDEPVKLWQHFDSLRLPSELENLIMDGRVIKVAWNASFERTALERLFNWWVPYEEWIDPMIYARYLSLPGGLSEFAKNMGLPTDSEKDADGKRLIKLFCEPIRDKKRKLAENVNVLFDISPTGNEPREVRFNDWKSHPQDWEKFGQYCKQDVVAERDALNFCEKYFPLPEVEKRGWYLDQKINQAGMPADDKFAENCVILATQAKENALREQKALTGLDNPNSNSQMLKWVQGRGYPFSSLRKEPVKIAIDSGEIKDKDCLAVLALRGESAKTSYTKLKKIRSSIAPDGRLRNQFMYMGSARGGRWAGKDVNLQNLARPVKELEDQQVLDAVRDCIYKLDYEGVKKIYPSVLTAITSCIRSTFVAPKGKRLNVCDLNAIETRVSAWFCQCEPLMEVFRKGYCPYVSFAAKMYGIPGDVLQRAYERGDKDAKQKRFVAKPAILGCCYRLSGGDWKKNKYGDMVKGGLWGYAESMGVKMTKEDAHKAVAVFRSSYSEIKYMWYALEDAVAHVIKKGGTVELGPQGCVVIGRVARRGKKPIVYIQLPSGRRLHYIDASLVEKEWPGKDGVPYKKISMQYKGINQDTKQWVDIDTNGGKLLENIVQGMARDVLLNSMFLIDEKGMEIVGHVHDETITVSDDDPLADGLNTLKWCMSQPPVFMPGFFLTADGYESLTYRKG